MDSSVSAAGPVPDPVDENKNCVVKVVQLEHIWGFISRVFTSANERDILRPKGKLLKNNLPILDQIL
jgi:hypothetical protein